MLAITYGQVFKPKTVAQQYDLVLDGYTDANASASMIQFLQGKNDDVYIEDGKVYMPAFRSFMYSSIDYTLVYIPRSKGLNIIVPKDKLPEFVGFLQEYNAAIATQNITLRDFIMGKLKDRPIPYFYPAVALYYDVYAYLYIAGIELALPVPSV